MSQNPAPSGGPSPSNATGTRIGKYTLVKPLGKGAMGVVYLAHDTVLERDVALKLMSAQIADDPELKQRFEREAKAVARMTHPNVVAVFDLGQHDDGSLYIAMELLKGQDLQKALRAQPPMSLDRKVAIVLQVLAGLHHAHQAGIVHRDIKPANIFIGSDGSVKIMDFGVARLTTASMTGTGNIVGTADYMSPEQVKGAKVDGRSDLFSVGVVLFELLSGRRPFHAENLMAIFYKITHQEPDYELIPGGEEYDALLPVLQRALSKDLDERYAGAYPFALDLRSYLATYSTSASGRHVLENLVDLEAPTGAPAAFGTAGTLGALGTLVDGDPTSQVSATLDLSRAGAASLAGTAPMAPAGATHAGAGTPTLRGRTGATVAPGGRQLQPTAPPARRSGGTLAPTGLAPAEARAPQVRPPARPARAPQPPPSRAPLYAGLAVAALAAAAAGWWLLNRPVPPPPVSGPSSLPATPAPVASVAPPPSAPPTAASPELAPTPAPVPSLGPVAGPGAAALRSAQGAFGRGDYVRALRDAQAALRADPQSADARVLVDNATKGQQARARLGSAEAALGRGDVAQALIDGEAARSLAPWDAQVSDFLARARESERRAAQQAQSAQQQQQAARVQALLKEADDALGAQRFDAALALYEQALQLDPQNQRASLGRTGALAARATARATPTGPAGSTRTFSFGRTEAQGTGRGGGSAPAGFEDSPEVTAKKGSQAADLPGKILFEVTPASVKAGERYAVRVVFLNEGSAPVGIRALALTTAVNGRKSSGPVVPSVREVAPQQKAVLHQVADLWSDETTSWSMEVTVSTVRGELYTNRLTWK